MKSRLGINLRKEYLKLESSFLGIETSKVTFLDMKIDLD